MTGGADETREFFVSFNRTDREWAAWIAWVLEEEGYSVFFQDWDFKGNFVLEMDRALRLSRRTVAVLSPAYLAATFTHSEWSARFAEDGTNKQDLLVPIRVRPCELRGLLAPIISADLVGVTREEARRRILERVADIRPEPTERLQSGVAGTRRKPVEEPSFPGEPQPSEPSFPPVADNPPPLGPHSRGNDKPQKVKRQPHLHLLVALAAALIATAVTVSSVGQWLEREFGLPGLFLLWGPISRPPDVVIVAQDRASSHNEAIRRAGYLDAFPRTRLAEVVDKVTATGATALALDLALYAAAQDESEDEKLANALTANGKAVLFVASHNGDDGTTIQDPRPEFAKVAAALAPFTLPQPQKGALVSQFLAFHGTRATLPAAALLVAALTDPKTRDALKEGARAEGMSKTVEDLLAAEASALPPDLTPADLFSRRVAALRLEFRRAPAAARLLAVRLLPPPPGPHRLSALLPAAAVRVLGGEDAYILAPYGPAGRVLHVQFQRVMEEKPEDLPELKEAIVFIGASEVKNSGPADPDRFDTALSGEFGVEIAATACLNLLNGDVVLNPTWPVMALFAGGVAAAVIAASAALPPLAALVTLPIAAFLVATGLAYLALDMLRVALPIASALIVSLPLGLLGDFMTRYAYQSRAAQRQRARALGLL